MVADTQLMKLAAGAHVYLRGRNAVQFGLDATRAGIVETTQAPMVVAGLLIARRPRTVAQLRTGLINAGLSADAARSLIDDLTAYRILVPMHSAAVFLLGRSHLAEATAALLRASGVVVRSPVRGESEFAFLAAAEVDAPVLVIDRLAHSKALAPMLTRFASTWLPGAIIDRRGVVGPLRIDGVGPCPLCVDLHRTDLDEYWHRVVTQVPGGPENPDPVVIAATAAVLSARALALVRSPGSPGTATALGMPLRALEAGAQVSVDPYASGVNVAEESVEWLNTHRRCPVCFVYRKESRTASSSVP